MENPSETPICLFCGETSEQRHSDQESTQIKLRQRSVFIMMAVFAGWFGAHNLYLGYTKRAIAQILLTVVILNIHWILFPILFLWILAEICMVDRDASGRSMN